MSRYSIEAEQISVSYKIVKSMSLRQLFARSAVREERVEYVKALDDISFKIEKGRTIGLIGANGAGKTTLLKTLAGVFAADSGEIRLHSDSISLLTLGTGFEPNLTGIHNIYANGILLGLKREQIDTRLSEIIDFADIGDFVYKPLRTYSSGMRARLAFAIAANVEPDILLLDEMLGVGDQDFRDKSTRRIRELILSHRTVLLAAHNMTTIRELCDSVIWLHKGRLRDAGETDKVVDNYLSQTRDASQAREGR